MIYAKWVVYMSDIKVMRYALFTLYFTGDSILSTKTALVTFFGEYVLVLAELFYKEPRPYWIDVDIQAYQCEIDFEGPSDHLFLLTFLPMYVNLIYLRKYSRKPEISLS